MDNCEPFTTIHSHIRVATDVGSYYVYVLMMALLTSSFAHSQKYRVSLSFVYTIRHINVVVYIRLGSIRRLYLSLSLVQIPFDLFL